MILSQLVRRRLQIRNKPLGSGYHLAPLIFKFKEIVTLRILPGKELRRIDTPPTDTVMGVGGVGVSPLFHPQDQNLFGEFVAPLCVQMTGVSAFVLSLMFVGTG